MNGQYDDLERELREVLRRRDPSPDFAARVVAAAEAERRRRVVLFPVRYWMAAAAAVLTVVGGLGLREYQQGLEAKRQLLMALTITSEKLNAASDKIEEVQRRSHHE
ncbi:MAG: hypothetical protein R2729_21345 [Bryobacteraceae bacterium]